MDRDKEDFARRYRGWIDGYTLGSDRAQAVWQRIFNAMELCQGPPEVSERHRLRPDSRPCCRNSREERPS